MQKKPVIHKLSEDDPEHYLPGLHLYKVEYPDGQREILWGAQWLHTEEEREAEIRLMARCRWEGFQKGYIKWR